MREMRAGRLTRLPAVVGAALLVACSTGGTPPASPFSSVSESSGAEGSPAEGSAPASPGPMELGTVTLVSDECSLDVGAATVDAASITVTAVNETEHPGAFDMWRIDDDHSYQDLVDHVAAEAAAASEGKPGLGHPGFVSGNVSSGIVEAGESARIEGAVRPGTYAIVCLGHFDAVPDDPFRPRAVVGPITVR